MKRIILQYMKSKKVDVAILIIATFLLSFFSVISYFAAKNICYEKKLNGIRTYGSFIYGTWTDDPKKAPKVTQDSKIRTGFCRIYEDAKISGTTITYGCPGQNFSDMTNMQLLKGRMPKNDNEIAMESFAAELTGVTKPGDTVSLLFNGKKQKFTVSGIIRNYSAFLNICESETSSRIYPNIVFSKQKVKQKSSKK